MPIPHFHELTLPANYSYIEFLADTHLDPNRMKTVEAWSNYMANTEADAIFILGDLFESWIGNDILKAPVPLGDFERQCTNIIQQVSRRKPVYIIPGNRDFLLGEKFAEITGSLLLPEPTILLWANRRAVITHGDLLCTDDVKYQEYRKMVRSSAWQEQILTISLETRIKAAQQMREQSEASKQVTQYDIMDVNINTVSRWLDAANSDLMIHGHTHRPADHALLNNKERIVLSYWDLDVSQDKQKAEILQWSLEYGLERIPIIA